MPTFRPANSLDVLRQRYGSRYKWIALFVIGGGTVAGVLCATSFNVAIPALANHFGLGQGQVQWAMTGFLAAMTVSMLPVSWLLDRYGLRTVFLLALMALVVASVAGFLATTFSLVVAARVVQGVAAGILQPMGTLALMRLFPPEMQGRAMGVLIFSIVLTPAVAPSLGGVLLDGFGWEAIFLLAVPFAAIAGLAGVHLLPAHGRRQSMAFDWFGLTFLMLATAALAGCVSSMQSGHSTFWTAGLLTLSLGSGLLYVRHARRCRQPIISLALFGRRTFAMGAVVSFACGFGLYASTYLIPVYLQHALSFSASAAGVAMVPAGVALAAVLLPAGRMCDSHAPKWIALVGLLLFGVSFLVFARQGGEIRYHEIIAATVLGRIGLGLILPAQSLATLRNLHGQELGQSTVVINYVRQLGGVVGVAVVAVFIEWRASVVGEDLPGLYLAYAQGFVLLSCVLMAAAFAAFFMDDQRGRGERDPPAPA